MSQTTNYALDKYDAGDVPNLLDQYNSSMDTIDLQLKSQSDRITTLESHGGSGGATTVTAGDGVSVTGSSSAGYTVSLQEASDGTIGGVYVTEEIDPSAPVLREDPCVPTYKAVKDYVDSHSGGGGSASVSISGSNGVSATSTAANSFNVAGVNASTSQVGVVRLTANVGDNSGNVPTAAAVKSYVDSHSGSGGLSVVNASNGIQGSIQGSTLTLSGVEATPTTLGMVNKVGNMTGGGTASVPTVQAVMDYVAQQGGGGTGSGVTSIAAGTGIQVSGSTGAVTVSARSASTTQAGIVRLATNGTSSTDAATPSYVNTVQQNLSAATNVLHQSLYGSASGMTNMTGDVFIFTGLGIGIAMLYAQTSSPITPGTQKKYNYTLQSQYRPPQQAQVMRLYNHLTGSAILAQVRTDGTICWSCEGGSGADFVGAAVVTWAFEV